MFIGHIAVALAAKKAAPKVSFGTLTMAVQFVDLLWPIFLLLGIEHVRIDPGNTAFTPSISMTIRFPTVFSLLLDGRWDSVWRTISFAAQ